MHSESTQTSKMELLARIDNGFQLFTIFVEAPSLMFDWVLNTPLDLSCISENIADQRNLPFDWLIEL